MVLFRFGDYTLDADRRLLIGPERVIPLSAKAFGVLQCMLRAAGATVSKEELISEVWQHDDVSDATIVQHVWMLRRALREGAKSREYILTIPREGYRFVAPVTRVSETAPAPPSDRARGAFATRGTAGVARVSRQPHERAETRPY